MVNYEELLKHLEYFNNKKSEIEKWAFPNKNDAGEIELGYPVYDEGFNKFIDDFYRSDLADGDYLSKLEKYTNIVTTPAELIETANLDMLKSILTYYVRQERFCDGIWAEAIEKGIFLKSLLRLKEIMQD